MKLYGGPVYLMHFKYSSILNQVWVSFFYGMFLPILFPIALIGIINMYIVERITLAWFYRQPPSFDGKLNDAAIKILSMAPVSMFILGYWALGNRQIFYGDAEKIYHENEIVDPKHSLVEWDDLFKHEGLILILLAVLIVSKICMFIYNLYQSSVLVDDDAAEDEGLAPFWNSLTGEVQKKFFANESFLQSKLKLRTIDEKMTERLRTAQRTGKQYITGLANYDLLRNIIYQDELEYYPIEQCDDAEDLIQNAFVTNVLYIGEHNKI